MGRLWILVRSSVLAATTCSGLACRAWRIMGCSSDNNLVFRMPVEAPSCLPGPLELPVLPGADVLLCLLCAPRLGRETLAMDRGVSPGPIFRLLRASGPPVGCLLMWPREGNFYLVTLCHGMGGRRHGVLCFPHVSGSLANPPSSLHPSEFCDCLMHHLQFFKLYVLSGEEQRERNLHQLILRLPSRPIKIGLSWGRTSHQ